MPSQPAQYTGTVSMPARPAAGTASAVALWLALMAASPAHAELPLVSETADSPASGECQVELALLRTTAQGHSRLHGQQAYASCGTPWNGQLGVLIAREHGGGDPRATLLGVHGKSTLVAPDEAHTGWGIAYGLTSDHLSGEGWQHGSSHLTLVATRRLTASLIGHANLGWQRAQRDHSSTTVWSLGLETEGGSWGWAADLYGDDRSRPWISAGVVLWPNDRLALSLNHARQFDAQRATQWTLGSRIKF